MWCGMPSLVHMMTSFIEDFTVLYMLEVFIVVEELIPFVTNAPIVNILFES